MADALPGDDDDSKDGAGEDKVEDVATEGWLKGTTKVDLQPQSLIHAQQASA